MNCDLRVRKHTGPTKNKITPLADYREWYAQYRADPLLHGMHAKCPRFVTWDDHEFDNNYAGEVQEIQPKGVAKADPVEFLERRAAAYQAYYEMMPLRKRSLPTGPDMLVYRKAVFGRLAEFFVLDTRQYRSPTATASSRSSGRRSNPRTRSSGGGYAGGWTPA